MEHASNAFIQLFPQKDIQIILRAIVLGGQTLRKKTASEKENLITIRLHKKLIRDYPFRDGPFSIQLQPQIPLTDTDEDSIDGQIDLLVPSTLGFQTYFAIEAKRLRYISPSGQFVPGNSAYVNEGMMRFISGQYAPFMRSGAMLGYVFDEDIQSARTGIDNYIQTKCNELKIKPPGRLKKSDIISAKVIDETHHDLASKSFIIFHLFLSV
ncbi:MAG: hypothetical protein JW927_15855 [Deltaproteobacteria bacterium]|nr:hypothetical protein [Deltaproteobacteria bacterium]